MNKKIIIPSVLIAVAAVSIGLFSFNSEPYVYVQSDITKANPNINIGDGAYAMLEDIDYVKEYVVLTATGNVVNVDDPMPWMTPNGDMHAGVPVTITVSDYSKDTEQIELERGSELTFYLDGIYHLGGYYMHNFEPQFEIGEEVIVHLGSSEYGVDGLNGDNYYVELGQFGKYKVVEDKAYNENYIDGISVNEVFDEALENDTVDDSSYK